MSPEIFRRSGWQFLVLLLMAIVALYVGRLIDFSIYFTGAVIISALRRR